MKNRNAVSINTACDFYGYPSNFNCVNLFLIYLKVQEHLQMDERQPLDNNQDNNQDNNDPLMKDSPR